MDVEHPIDGAQIVETAGNKPSLAQGNRLQDPDRGFQVFSLRISTVRWAHGVDGAVTST